MRAGCPKKPGTSPMPQPSSGNPTKMRMPEPGALNLEGSIQALTQSPPVTDSRAKEARSRPETVYDGIDPQPS